MYSVRAHLQGEYEDMKDCYKTLLTYIKVGIVSFFLPSSPPSSKHHEGMGREEKERWKGEEGGGEERKEGKEKEVKGRKGKGGREEDFRKQMGLNEPVALCCFPP